MTEWEKYTGSDEQIAEMAEAKHGFIVRDINGEVSGSILFAEPPRDFGITEYWVIHDDPMREMKIRQAETGQPVWVRRPAHRFDWDRVLGSVMVDCINIEKTTAPDWNIPNAEYSFTPFEDCATLVASEEAKDTPDEYGYTRADEDWFFDEKD